MGVDIISTGKKSWYLVSMWKQVLHGSQTEMNPMQSQRKQNIGKTSICFESWFGGTSSKNVDGWVSTSPFLCRCGSVPPQKIFNLCLPFKASPVSLSAFSICFNVLLNRLPK